MPFKIPSEAEFSVGISQAISSLVLRHSDSIPNVSMFDYFMMLYELLLLGSIE